jgi:hypothetical protein
MIELDYYDNSDVSHETFYEVLKDTIGKCQATHGKVEVTRQPTTFVVDGSLFSVKTVGFNGGPGIEVKFWVGVNDRRLFYITYVEADPASCKDIFQFCFGGAEKAGWSVNYECIVGFAKTTTSIWATVFSDEYLMERPRPGQDAEFTRAGRFWAVDIAMMLQSQIRTMERHFTLCSPYDPEPL